MSMNWSDRALVKRAEIIRLSMAGKDASLEKEQLELYLQLAKLEGSLRWHPSWPRRRWDPNPSRG